MNATRAMTQRDRLWYVVNGGLGVGGARSWRARSRTIIGPSHGPHHIRKGLGADRDAVYSASSPSSSPRLLLHPLRRVDQPSGELPDIELAREPRPESSATAPPARIPPCLSSSAIPPSKRAIQELKIPTCAEPVRWTAALRPRAP